MDDVKDNIKFVITNIGKIPIEDYRDILAYHYGYDSYEELIQNIKNDTDFDLEEE